MPKKYKGEARGSGPLDATGKAFDEAWDKAKADGAHGKKLRVDEWYVKGENPLNWSSIVLVDEDDT
jgi:hypothetical protein